MKPKLIETAELARQMGWSTERARRWGIRHGMAIKRLGRWYIPLSVIATAFPEVAQGIVTGL